MCCPQWWCFLSAQHLGHSRCSVNPCSTQSSQLLTVLCVPDLGSLKGWVASESQGCDLPPAGKWGGWDLILGPAYKRANKHPWAQPLVSRARREERTGASGGHILHLERLGGFQRKRKKQGSPLPCCMLYLILSSDLGGLY